MISESGLTLTFGSSSIPYTIVRSSRKTLGISVEPSGQVIVKAPSHTDLETIQTKVHQKRHWIAKKVQEFSKIKEPSPKMQEPVNGEKIHYKNKLYRLKIHLIEENTPFVRLIARYMHIYIPSSTSEEDKGTVIKQVLIQWYKEKCGKYIRDRIQKHQKLFAIKPKEIEIRDLQQRWGSCTNNRKLIFNWKIIMAPISAIDYVLLHELCHLVEPDHSLEFWSLLESVMPSYKHWKEWLLINGLNLQLRW